MFVKLLLSLILVFSPQMAHSAKKATKTTKKSQAKKAAQFDLSHCKANSYYSNAKEELKLKDKKHCGDIKGRFKKAKKKNALVYDSFLKGHWSKKSKKNKNYKKALAYCSALGKGWDLATIYQLISLVQKEADKKSEEFINPLFSDNESKWYWSKTLRPNSFSIGWMVDYVGGDVDLANEPLGRARCFRPGSP